MLTPYKLYINNQYGWLMVAMECVYREDDMYYRVKGFTAYAADAFSCLYDHFLISETRLNRLFTEITDANVAKYLVIDKHPHITCCVSRPMHGLKPYKRYRHELQTYDFRRTLQPVIVTEQVAKDFSVWMHNDDSRVPAFLEAFSLLLGATVKLH